MKKRETLIVAHRGAKGLVKHENSIEAFDKAIEVGSDIIETDIRKTLDNVIIINHDPTINGLVIKDHTYEEMNQASESVGFHLLTLDEALSMYKGKITFDIELKEVGYEQEILDIILKHLKVDEFFLRSFHDQAILNVKNINPHIYCYLLVGRGNIKFRERLTEIFPHRRMKKCKADGISPLHKIMILGFIKRMHLRNVKISVWTVNDEELMKKLLKKHVDSIVTNYPDKALKMRNTLKK